MEKEDSRISYKGEYKVNTKKRWMIVICVQAVLIAFGVLWAVWAQSDVTEETFLGVSVPVYTQKQQSPVGMGLELKRGSYEITLTYQTENETVCQPFMYTAYGEDYGDKVLLLKEAQQKTFELMLYRDVRDFYLLSGDMSLQAEQMTIRRTAQWNWIICALLVISMLLVDAYLWQRQKKWWENLPKERRGSIVAVVSIGVLASLPLFTNYLLNGADLSFHLMRIEGLAEGLRQGNFPVKMQPLWVNDHGYPVSVMYGDALLYVPALLTLCGFTVQTAYKVYLFGMNLLTAAVSYHCGKTISKSTNIGIIASVLYTLSGYRLTNAVYRAALGEVTAMAFLPLVFLGLWQIFSYEEGEDKSQLRRGAGLLILGYTGILQSHLLSFEMAILFSVIFCLMQGRRFVKRCMLLVKTGLVTIGVNLFYLVPFLDYMLTQDMHVFYARNIRMQDTGLFLPQLMQMFTYGARGVNNGIMAPVSYGISDELVIGIGFPVMAVIFLYLWERLVHKKRLLEINGAGEAFFTTRLFLLVLLSLWMSTYFFPWNIPERIPQLATILAPYQFPMRFTAMALVFAVLLGAYALKNLRLLCDGITAKLVFAGLCLLAVLHFLFYSGMLLALQEPIKVTGAGGLDTRNAVITGEYLLENTYAGSVNDVRPKADEGIVIHDYKKEKGVITLSVENTGGNEGHVSVPFFAYKGYQAKDHASGTQLPIDCDYQNIMMLRIPADYHGEITVAFSEPLYWRMAEAVSLIVLGGIVFFQYAKKKPIRMKIR